MGRILLLHNPAARRAPGAALLGSIRAELERAGWGVEAVPTQRPNHATDLTRAARAQGFERVVVCGGDGSVREVAEGLFGTDLPLAVIPLGTANVLAWEMGLPADDPVACTAIAATGRPTPIGLGTVGGSAFTFSASCGLDALAVERVSLSLKARAGKLAYGASALESLLEGDLPTFEVETDTGERVEACQAFAVRATKYGNRNTILSRFADLRSPTMRLIALTPPLHRHLAALTRLFGEGLDGAPGAFSREVASFRLRSDAPLPIQADGDSMPGVEPEFVSHAEALMLVFPG